MDWITMIVCIIGIVFVVGMLVAIITDSVKSSWYDDARDSDYAPEKKRPINHIDKELDDKRVDYLLCMRDIGIISSDNVSNSMQKIDEYLTSYKLEQFNRFYTVYCRELSDVLKKIKDCKCSSLYYSLVTETRTTYGSIFSKMLADVEAFIKNNSSSVTDIEGIKNFAKINGDFDENYKAETASKSVSDTDTILTSTTSAVENKVNYADALNRAYEKVSQYKKENAQLAKELENCRAEAKKHCAKNMDNADAAEAKLRSDLEQLNEAIYYQELAGRNGATNDDTLKLMRETRHEIIKYVADWGIEHYNDHDLYCWGIPIDDYLKNWKAELDYAHNMYSDELDGIVYESL